MTLTNSIVSGNSASYGGGGINSFGAGGVTLTNSTVSDNTATDRGGGINSLGAVTLTNSTVSDNSAGTFGGGIQSNGAVTLTNSTVSGNTSGDEGGGISSNGAVTLTNNSTVSGNTSGDEGGGISSSSGVTLTNSIVSGNQAGTFGGGIYSRSGSVTLTDSTVSSNQASYGGGIFSDGVVTLTNSTVSDSTAAFNGGGIFSRSDVTLTNSTVSSNQASYGGGIFSDGVVTLTNSTVSSNSSSDSGGGIFSFFGGVSLTNSTVSGNTSGDEGGGISSSSGVTLTNSIVSGNSARNGGGIFSNGVSLTNSTISGNTATTGGGGGIFSSGVGVVTLTNNSTVSGNSAGTFGGGIRSNGGAVTLTNNSTVSGNTAAGDGGGIFSSGAVTLTNNSTVSGNYSGNYGGGIFSSSVVSLTNSTVSGNSASYGGGIYSNGGDVTLTNSTVSSNSSSDSGGGIFSLGVVSLTNSTVSGNTTGTFGGGIRISGSALSLTNSTVSDNMANSYGGGIFSTNSAVTLTDSTVSGNTSNNNGGGINSFFGGVNLTNSTVSGNTAGANGGGIRITGNLSLTNSTIAFNEALYIGGGLAFAVFSGPTPTHTFTNSIIANNTAPTGTDVGITNGTHAFTTTNSLILNTAGMNANGSTGVPTNGTNGNIVGVNPLLSALGNYGGSTQTVALLPGSPAINAAGAGAISTDQRGFASFGVRDLGAFESQGFTMTLGAGSPQSTTVNQPFTNLLTVNISANNPSEPVSGGLITFTAPSTDASLNAPSLTATIDGSGQANLTATANTTPGSYNVAATGSGISSTINFSLTNLADDVIANLAISSGNAQSGEKESSPIEDFTTTTELGEEATNIKEIEESDAGFSGEFNSYFGFDAAPEMSVTDIQDVLRTVEKQLNFRTALIYMSFQSPDEIATNNPDNSELSENLAPSVISSSSLPADVISAFNKEAIKNEKETQTEPRGTKETLWKFKNDRSRSYNQDKTTSPNDILVLNIATSDALYTKKLEITYREAMRLSQNLSRALANPRFGDSYLGFSRDLYEAIIKPIETELQTGNINNLTLLAPSGMRTVPWAALYDGQEFLIEKYSIGMMPSFALTDHTYKPIENPNILAMGASEFTDLNSLPAVPAELEIITQNIYQNQKFYLNEDFTLNQFQTLLEQEEYSIVHLATHGKFEGQTPEDSYIQFWDGKLNLKDLQAVKFKVTPELLVLSACQTALGNSEAELGFAGLAVVSGIPSVLGSLWNISDVGTYALMGEFYSQLQENPIKAEALRQTQLQMLRGNINLETNSIVRRRGETEIIDSFPVPEELTQGGNIDFTHPYFWGSFTLIGKPW